MFVITQTKFLLIQALFLLISSGTSLSNSQETKFYPHLLSISISKGVTDNSWGILSMISMNPVISMVSMVVMLLVLMGLRSIERESVDK